MPQTLKILFVVIYSVTKRPELEAYHSSPSSAEVENARRYTATHSIRLHCVVLT